MEVIYSLIPAMIFIGLALVVVLVWAIRRGQYEDLEGDAHRILHDDDDPNLPAEMRGQKKKATHSDKVMPDADDD